LALRKIYGVEFDECLALKNIIVTSKNNKNLHYFTVIHYTFRLLSWNVLSREFLIDWESKSVATPTANQEHAVARLKLTTPVGSNVSVNAFLSENQNYVINSHDGVCFFLDSLNISVNEGL